METVAREVHPTVPGRSRWGPMSMLVVLALAAIAGGILAIWAYQSDGSDDQSVATELADTWLRGWDENDAEAIRSVFTANAVYYRDPAHPGSRMMTIDELVRDVGATSSRVTNVSRVGELTATDRGTFIFVAEFDGDGIRYSAEAEIELDGDLISRMEWLSLDEVGP